MAGGKTNYFEEAVLRLVFLGVAPTIPSSLHLALSTAPYAETGIADEVTGGGYARSAINRGSGEWAVPTGIPTTTKNLVDIPFPVATGSWGTITSFYVMDAPTGGNSLYGADLAIPKSVLVGDAATFYANTLTISED